jgi:large subunit ribosomal protein L5
MAKKFGCVESATNSLINRIVCRRNIMSQLKDYYVTEVVPKLVDAFQYRNRMEIPKLDKIVLNMGLGEAIHNIKIMDSAVEELKAISGQKPVITRSKKSIAAFKLREKMPIGCMVTLRQDRMYDFFYKLVNVALARVRDFKGISGKAFDGRGNYTLGIKENTIFPELSYDTIDVIKGLNVTVVTTANTDKEGKELLKLLGMPFRN